MNTLFKFHSDPAHAWLAVPRALINEYGIADKISKYSYQSFDTVFLEEDCDASLFFNAYESKHGQGSLKYETIHTNSESKIRRMPRYEVNHV